MSKFVGLPLQTRLHHRHLPGRPVWALPQLLPWRHDEADSFPRQVVDGNVLPQHWLTQDPHLWLMSQLHGRQVNVTVRPIGFRVVGWIQDQGQDPDSSGAGFVIFRVTENHLNCTCFILFLLEVSQMMGSADLRWSTYYFEKQRLPNNFCMLLALQSFPHRVAGSRSWARPRVYTPGKNRSSGRSGRLQDEADLLTSSKEMDQASLLE